MDLMPTEDQEQIIDAARTLLSKELAVDYLRWEEGPAAAKDRSLLPMFAELGWFGLGLPEADGGIGFTLVEEMLLLREAGRYLVTPMLLAGIMGAHLAAKADVDLTAQIIAGSTRCGLAITRPDGDSYLIDADACDLVLVAGRDTVELVDRQGFGTSQPLRGLDGAVTLARAVATGRGLVAKGGEECCDHLSLLVAGCLTGISEAVRDLTVDHANERVQFGQKIGAFQAVSHPCADMAVRCEAALSQAKFAAVTLRDGLPGSRWQVTAARVVAAEAAVANATASVQLHGGMGFAAEYPVHFYLKRAHLLSQVGGDRPVHLDRLLTATAA